MRRTSTRRRRPHDHPSARPGVAMPTKSIDKEWVDVLADVHISQGLSRRHLSRIAGMATLQEVAPHTQIVRAGEPGDALYVLIDGQAEARQPGHKGVEMGSRRF